MSVVDVTGFLRVPTVRPTTQRNSRCARISSFFGIVIAMYYDDHAPPHFHIVGGGRTGRIAIQSLEVWSGDLSPRELRLVRVWADAHRAELLASWQRARAHLPLRQIEPLDRLAQWGRSRPGRPVRRPPTHRPPMRNSARRRFVGDPGPDVSLRDSGRRPKPGRPLGGSDVRRRAGSGLRPIWVRRR
ncbi:MAG: DUF4160 domain-containing protein [Acidimicrobiia bacterium]